MRSQRSVEPHQTVDVIVLQQLRCHMTSRQDKDLYISVRQSTAWNAALYYWDTFTFGRENGSTSTLHV